MNHDGTTTTMWNCKSPYHLPLFILFFCVGFKVFRLHLFRISSYFTTFQSPQSILWHIINCFKFQMCIFLPVGVPGLFGSTVVSTTGAGDSAFRPSMGKTALAMNIAEYVAS